MKVRTKRTHYMGQSNRDRDHFSTKSKDIMEASYIKSQSCYYKTASNLQKTSQKDETPTRIHPFNGTHNEFESCRFDKTNLRKEKPSKWKLEAIVPPLDFSSQLNHQVRTIRDEFQGKQINMHKLNQLKHTFIKNNRDRRNLSAYFQKFANEKQQITNKEMKSIVKEYGYDISDDEAKLIFKLTTGGKKEQLDMSDFVELMTKDNVYFRTFKFSKKDRAHAKTDRFSEKVHLILRNKFHNLQEAFRIFTMRNETITEQKYNSVMKKLDITDLVMSNEERRNVFNMFKTEGGQFNVEALLGSIAEQENNIKKDKTKVTGFEDNMQFNEELNFQKEAKPTDLVFKRMSSLQYQNQYQRAMEVIEQLRKINKSKDVLNQLCSNKVSKDKLRQNAELFLQKNGINFNKNSYDCFTSFFDYNQRGDIQKDQLKRFLIDETNKQAMQRFERRVRILPPSNNAQNESSGFDGQAAYESLQKIKGVKLNPQMKELFQSFDKDHDGYVSKNEFKKKIAEMNVLEQWQLDNLSNYFDADRKGYMTYKQFSEKYSNQPLPNQNLKKLEGTASIRFKSHSDWLTTKRTFIQATNQYKYNVPTKFSAWPDRLNETDLSLIQPPMKSGQFMSQNDRFINSDKHNLGNEHKILKNKIYQNKLKKLATWNQSNYERIAEKVQKQQNRDQARNYSMRMAKQLYEMRCHQQP